MIITSSGKIRLPISLKSLTCMSSSDVKGKPVTQMMKTFHSNHLVKDFKIPSTKKPKTYERVSLLDIETTGSSDNCNDEPYYKVHKNLPKFNKLVKPQK